MEPTNRDPFALTGKKQIRAASSRYPSLADSLDPVRRPTPGLVHSSGVRFPRPSRGALTALFLISSWALAVRLLLLESRARTFWIVWVFVAAGFVVLSGAGSSLWIVGMCLNSIFLGIRFYRPFSRLTHAHRARAFFLDLGMFSLLSWGWFIGPNGGFAWNGAVAGWFQNLSRFSLISLQIFWVFALIHIFFKARLHSVKIRPKLTISTILIAVAPILLILIMSGVMALSIMGETQAARAAKVMNDWAELAGREPRFARTFSQAGSSATKRGEWKAANRIGFRLSKRPP